MNGDIQCATVSGQGIVCSNSVISTGTSTVLYTSPSVNVTLPNYQENKSMDRCGISIDCTVPSYAWHGLDFALHCVGIAILIGATCLAAIVYKKVTRR